MDLKKQEELGLCSKNDKLYEERERNLQKSRDYRDNLFNKTISKQNKMIFDNLVAINSRENVITFIKKSVIRLI